MSRRVDNYEKLSEIDHILCRPDMYVGSNIPEKREEFVAFKDESSNGYIISKKEVTYPPGLLRIFIEILSNAIDNVQRSRKEGIKCTKIKVSIDKETGKTSIWNDGKVIPVEKNSEGEYIHTMIFGQLRTSSNYNDEEERMVSGRNGMGGKVCCVFSTSFNVQGGDPEVKKQLSQTWTNNMKNVENPIISSYKNVNGFTNVTYVPDFKQFGMTQYTDDIIQLYNKYIIDAAMLTKVNVYLNDENITIKTLTDYAKLYCGNAKDVINIVDEQSGEAVLLASPTNEFNSISFVNGVHTMNGGKHVDIWSEAFFRPLVDKFNDKKDRPGVNIKEVKQFFTLFVNSTLPNPIFESQSKTQLISPSFKVSVPQSAINKILKWETMNKITAIIKEKELSVLKKSESKRSMSKHLEGVDHANKAGTKHASDCSLILCEGDSAKTFAVAGIDVPLFGKKGKDWFGIYKLRGKIMNPKNHTPKQIADNKILFNLIKALNLRVDIDYRNEENFKTLNYGKVIILVDQDHDGFHIGGLILNFFHTLYPSLMYREEPYIVSMMTPIARVFLSNKTLTFYDQRKYDEYMKDHSDSSKLKVKYYKGLGSSKEEEVLETYGKKIIQFYMDDKANETIEKVFSKTNANQRKEWLSAYDPSTYLSIPDDQQFTKMSISDYMNNEVIKFSIDDCARNIPSIMDGLKEGQRKVLFACFKKNLTTKELKVPQLAGYVAEHTAYHHGEANLFGTIIGMATCFVGSNNIPLLERGGQFGTRLMGGKDAAAARYITTKLESLTRIIYPEEDDILLDKCVDDGLEVEPTYYVPIIPMVLVNGVSGAIGTGWSSNIPAYNPLDLCKYIENWLNKKDNIELVPWYRFFKGTIEKQNENRFISNGILNKVTNNKFTISELPIGEWTESFKDKLEELVDNRVIKEVRDYSTTQNVHFDLIENDTQEITPELLKLHSYLSTSNMVLFSKDGHIKKYDTIDDIMEEYCNQRLLFYEKRKIQLASLLKKKLNKAKLSLRFINDVMNDVIIIYKRDVNEIYQDMISLGYNNIEIEPDESQEEGDDNNKFSYLLKMQIRTFNRDKIKSLETTINEINSQLEKLNSKTPSVMWLDDLTNFRQKYMVWQDNMYKEIQRLDKIRSKK